MNAAMFIMFHVLKFISIKFIHCVCAAGVNDPEGDEPTDWQPLINTLLHLPKAHYNTLKHLMQHLSL